jgi:hypothetical protein
LTGIDPCPKRAEDPGYEDQQHGERECPRALANEEPEPTGEERDDTALECRLRFAVNNGVRTRDDSGKLFDARIAGPTLTERDKVGTGRTVHLCDSEKAGRSGLVSPPTRGRYERVELVPIWLPFAKQVA